MGSNLTPATFSVLISEYTTLNGDEIKSDNIIAIDNVSFVDKRTMYLIPNQETGIMTFSTLISNGTFIRGDLKYLRITNLDTVNYARLRVKKTSSYCFDIDLQAGKSFMMGNTKIRTSETAAAFISFDDADSISGQAYNTGLNIEYIVAST